MLQENSSKADDALQAGQTVLDRSNVEQYVDLGSSFSKMSEWSNDPTDMKLDLYFSKNPSTNFCSAVLHWFKAERLADEL